MPLIINRSGQLTLIGIVNISCASYTHGVYTCTEAKDKIGALSSDNQCHLNCENQ